jgi:hypothetical protein
MLVVRTRFWPYPPPPLARRRPYPGARVAVPARVPGYTVIPGTMAIPLFAGLGMFNVLNNFIGNQSIQMRDSNCIVLTTNLAKIM